MRKYRFALAATAVLTLILTGCATGQGETEPDPAEPSKFDPALAALLPTEITEKGSLEVATISYPPAVITGATADDPLTGWEPAIAESLSERLGIDFDFTVIPFASVIPGLEAGRYDIAMSSIAVLPERLEVVHFVTDFEIFSAFLTLKEDDFAPTELSDLCGHRVGILAGATDAQTLEKVSIDCLDDGQEAVEVNAYPESSQAVLALQSERIDASLASAGALAELVKNSGDVFKITGSYDPALAGIAVAKTSYGLELADALSAAVNAMIAEGELEDILDEWNGGLGVIENSEVLTSED